MITEPVTLTTTAVGARMAAEELFAAARAGREKDWQPQLMDLLEQTAYDLHAAGWAHLMEPEHHA